MLTSFFYFLRILDEQRRLSLTNLLMLACIGRLGFHQGSSNHAELFTMFIAIGNYAVKRIVVYFESKIPKPIAGLAELEKALALVKDELETAKNKISSLSMAAGLRPPAPRR